MSTNNSGGVSFAVTAPSGKTLSHFTVSFAAAQPYTCDGCRCKVWAGGEMYGCREDDYDLCMSCHLQAFERARAKAAADAEVRQLRRARAVAETEASRLRRETAAAEAEALRLRGLQAKAETRRRRQIESAKAAEAEARRQQELQAAEAEILGGAHGIQRRAGVEADAQRQLNLQAAVDDVLGDAHGVQRRRRKAPPVF